MSENNKSNNTHRPKIGFALGSGLARGVAHIGVLRALKAKGIEPDIIVGTSIGAVVGGVYAMDRLDKFEEWARSLNKMTAISYFDLKVKSGGMIGGQKFLELLQDRLGDTKIEDLPIPFAAIATDMTTGQEICIRHGRLIDAMRASFSLPGVFAPVRKNRRWLLDGALVNPVPVSACQALGSNMTIAIDLNADTLGKNRRTGSSIPTVAGFDPLDTPDEYGVAKKKPLIQRLFRRETDSPSLFGVMLNTLNIVQDRLARSRMAGSPPDILIAPKIGHIGLLELEKVDELIKAGEDAVERIWPDLAEAYQILCVDSFTPDE